MTKFSKLGLSKSTCETLNDLGFEQPTPVQEKAIPMLLKNDPSDFIGLAQTGTGKTAAFGLPLIELIDSQDKATQALIMAPTRELGQQTAKQLVSFSSNDRSLNVEVVYGGAPITNQLKALKKPVQIIVATPGRLLDLIKRKSVKLDQIKYVILDEADEMLNMGFKEAIDEILSFTPDQKATWLFSATMPADIRKIIKKYMTNPLEVSINREERSNKDIAHKYVMTKTSNKLAALRRFLDLQPDMRGIMFCRTRRETQEIAEQLSKLGYNSESLHGELSQQQRDNVMRRFKSKSMQLLVATDVAARGIDVDDLTHVIHHTLPDQLESYTHRSGRTGRAGKKGISLVFINPREGRKITDLEKKIKVKFEHIDVPSSDSIKLNRVQQWVDLLMETEPDNRTKEAYKMVSEQLDFLSKEDLLLKILSLQSSELLNEDDGQDLNETVGGSPEKRDTGVFHRYFVNIGTVDGLNKSDVISFLSEVSGVSKKFFGTLEMKKNHTYFELDKKRDGGFTGKFKGIMIDDRAIRLNRDDNPKEGFSKQRNKRNEKKFSRKDANRRHKRKRR